MKRTPLRRVSKKRRALKKAVDPVRAALVEEVGYCQPCWTLGDGLKWSNLSVHEIAKGIHRQAALSERCAQLVACWDCNSGRLNDYSILPIEKQLAIKLLEDPEHFDLVTFNRLRGRADGAIGMADVVKYLMLVPQEN